MKTSETTNTNYLESLQRAIYGLQATLTQGQNLTNQLHYHINNLVSVSSIAIENEHFFIEGAIVWINHTPKTFWRGSNTVVRIESVIKGQRITG